MAECDKCGKQTMSFTCRYCGGNFCSEHRLPEKHGCDSLEEGLEEEKEEKDKWFQNRKVRTPETGKPRKPSLARDVFQTLTQSVTLSIILFTSAVFMLQGLLGQGFTELLWLEPGIESLIERPWSVLTVMLVHGNFFHIFANMVTFYFMGTPLEKLVGGKDLLVFYILSGLTASFAYIGFRNFLEFFFGSSLGIPVMAPAVGASGAVVAVFAAVAMIYPNAQVYLFFVVPMKMRTLLYGFGILEGINVAMKSLGIIMPVIGHFASSAHLAGLLVGVAYGMHLRKKYSTRSGVIDLLGY